MSKGLPRSLGRAGEADESTDAVHKSVLHSLAKIAASSVTVLTDNSGGASGDGTIEAITQVTSAAVGSTDAAQKAAFESAAGTVVDALKELIAQTQAINAVVPALSGALVDSITGTAADHTIGAVTKNLSGVGSSMAAATGVKTFVGLVTNRIAQLAYHVNKVCVACGVAPVVDSSGGASSTSLTFAEVATATGTATDGADATDAHAIVKVTDANATLTLMANAVKELATKLNACRSSTGGVMAVVATT